MLRCLVGPVCYNHRKWVNRTSLSNIQKIELPCMTVEKPPNVGLFFVFFGGVFIKVILITFSVEGYYF